MHTPPYALRFTFTPQLIAPVTVVIASSCALGARPASVSMCLVSVYSALEGFDLRITAVFLLYVYMLSAVKPYSTRVLTGFVAMYSQFDCAVMIFPDRRSH